MEGPPQPPAPAFTLQDVVSNILSNLFEKDAQHATDEDVAVIHAELIEEKRLNRNLKGQVDRLNEKVKFLNATIERTKVDSSVPEGSLEKGVTRLNRQIEEHRLGKERGVTEMKEMLAVQNAEREEEHQKAQDERAALNKLWKEIEKSQEKQQDKQDEMMKKLLVEREEKEKLLEDIRTETKKIEELKREQETGFSEARAKLDLIQAEEKKAKETLAQTQDEEKKAKETLTQIQATAEEAKETLTQTQKELKDKEDKLEAVKNELKEAENKEKDVKPRTSSFTPKKTRK
ncbi:hypothetical protein TrVE_jg929 [Triparma verrucosa]|uniref:Uncharacterized protein n=1 Tax=Triparma verrucosa TaxID=1606542 RepID=A0A9W7KTV1_9STRA|nr:hypothetical protein TrVE_jg929 [Triparma verrucosa]